MRIKLSKHAVTLVLPAWRVVTCKIRYQICRFTNIVQTNRSRGDLSMINTLQSNLVLFRQRIK